jgi:hypothetical protein
VFTFVAADLIEKFQNIENCMNEDRTHYTTVYSALEFEKKNETFMVNQNVTLSLLRLLRGLDFIRKLLDSLFHNQDNHKKSHELAVHAYEATLAFRHKWAVRQLAKTGLYLIPKKHDLIKIMLTGCDPDNERKENDKLFGEFLVVLNKVFSIIHKIYDENDFLELVLA